MLEQKDCKSEVDFDSESNPKGGKKIIDVEPSSNVAITREWPSELEKTKEGEHLFHSEMWVKGDPLHLIFDSSSQKNLISTKALK
jgi:hypothetical protein